MCCFTFVFTWACERPWHTGWRRAVGGSPSFLSLSCTVGSRQPSFAAFGRFGELKRWRTNSWQRRVSFVLFIRHILDRSSSFRKCVTSVIISVTWEAKTALSLYHYSDLYICVPKSFDLPFQWWMQTVSTCWSGELLTMQAQNVRVSCPSAVGFVLLSSATFWPRYRWRKATISFVAGCSLTSVLCVWRFALADSGGFWLRQGT